MMKTILVTGATDGIGKQVASQSAGLGHMVIVHGRNAKRVHETMTEIKSKNPKARVESVVADFEDLHNVDRMVGELESRGLKPDVLLNNAGLINFDRELLANGLEKTFMVNYLSSFYLTRKLLPVLLKSNHPRIVNISSMAQSGSIDFNNLNGNKRFDGYEAYALSKLCNVLFTYKLHRLYQHSGLLAVCLHPGGINTKILRKGWGIGGASVEVGAERELFAAFSDEVLNFSGMYLVNNMPAKSAAISYDEHVQDRLWQISSDLCGLSVKPE
ncbi:MAG: SDR family NAD(P)-dependent oxidoreductase [Bacteroidales bacterium]|nr:SDR family NAD(P)-dependent oxidoreductase [Bacteroidales bacterium]